MHLVEPDSGTFTNTQLARLAAYRMAVAAGFYTDWDGSAETTDAAALAWLRDGDAPAEPLDDRALSASERQALERCRATWEAGGYAGDGGPAPL